VGIHEARRDLSFVPWFLRQKVRPAIPRLERPLSLIPRNPKIAAYDSGSVMGSSKLPP
jgi:hypothetical protein